MFSPLFLPCVFDKRSSGPFLIHRNNRNREGGNIWEKKQLNMPDAWIVI